MNIDWPAAAVIISYTSTAVVLAYRIGSIAKDTVSRDACDMHRQALITTCDEHRNTFTKNLAAGTECMGRLDERINHLDAVTEKLDGTVGKIETALRNNGAR